MRRKKFCTNAGSSGKRIMMVCNNLLVAVEYGQDYRMTPRNGDGVHRLRSPKDPAQLRYLKIPRSTSQGRRC